VANYGSGTIAALPVRADGALDSPSAVFQDPQPTSSLARQQGPHAHCVVLDATNRFLYSCDLGADKIFIYRFDAAAGLLARNAPAAASVPAGSGPRHFAIGPGGRTAYVLDEIASTLIVFARNPDDGSLTVRQSLSTLPAGWKGENTAAEIALDATGRFLYTSNRGHDSLAEFAVAPDGGVRLAGFTPCGKGPRHFALDPSGRFLLVEDEGADAIAVFRVDADAGGLTPTGARGSAANPVCLVFGNPLP
jgi:6-phosphogluconolactonase